MSRREPAEPLSPSTLRLAKRSGSTTAMHHPRSAALCEANNRGVSYWSDGKGDDPDSVRHAGLPTVASLNAKNGLPIANFGTDAHVDLWKGLDRPVVQNGTIGATSPPIIIRDVAVVGASLKVGTALPTKLNTPGYIRGYDVRTGKLLWIAFIPSRRRARPGVETWLKDPQTGQDSWKYTGNTGAWGPHTGDEELGYVYIPVVKRPAATCTAASAPVRISIRTA